MLGVLRQIGTMVICDSCRFFITGYIYLLFKIFDLDGRFQFLEINGWWSRYLSWFTRQCSFSFLSFLAIHHPFLFSLHMYIQLVLLYCICPLYIYACPYNSLLRQSNNNPCYRFPRSGSIFVHCPQKKNSLFICTQYAPGYRNLWLRT